MEVTDNHFVIVYGGVAEGFTHFGPFDTVDDANRFAKWVRFINPNAYQILEMDKPGDEYKLPEDQWVTSTHEPYESET
jgi:hypothetical protein